MSDHRGSDGVQSPSKIIEQGSDESEMEKNVDSLFKVYTVSEVSRSLGKIKYPDLYMVHDELCRTENARLKSDLFSLIGENYGTILEAADAVQSMKQFAHSIEQSLSSIGAIKDPILIEENESKEGQKELDRLIDGIVKCPIVAWKMFRSGKLIESMDHCSASLQSLKSDHNQISTVLSSHLIACTELQIINAQTRIKKGASELLTGPVASIDDFRIDRLGSALLVHSGLHSKTHHTEEDLRKALLKIWSEPSSETSDETLRLTVLKHVQLFAFALVLGFPIQEAASVFTKHVNELTSSATKEQLCVIDKTLIEAQNSSTKLEGTLCELSISIFRRWLDLVWDSISSSSASTDLAILNFVLAFQRSYSLESDGVPYKQRAALVREQVEAKIGDDKVSFVDEFNLLLPCLHPEVHSLPPKYRPIYADRLISIVGNVLMTKWRGSNWSQYSQQTFLFNNTPYLVHN